MVPHIFGGPGSFPLAVAIFFSMSNEFSMLNEPPFTHSTFDRLDLSFSVGFWWALVPHAMHSNWWMIFRWVPHSTDMSVLLSVPPGCVSVCCQWIFVRGLIWAVELLINDHRFVGGIYMLKG